MSGKKKKEEDLEKPSSLESDLYDKVEDFFVKEKNCEKTGSATSFPLSLRVFGGTVYPDVFGICNPTEKDFQIYMGEGKISFRGRNFDVCKGQAISLQRFSDYVYLFFPKGSWHELDKEEKMNVETECKNLKLGLLIVAKDSCHELVKAHPNPALLEEENRTLVRNEIVHYFPNFIGPQENADFFERYPKLADNIVKESCELVDKYLVGSFTKILPVQKQSIKHWYNDDTFEFYLYSKVKNNEVLLIMKPFGSEIFETGSPTLLIQERFKSSIIKKQDTRKKLAKHIDECLKRKCEVDTEDLIFYDPDTSEEVLNHIEESKPKDFSIFERIEVLGVEKEQIKLKVEKSLQNTMNFLSSLKQN